METMDMDTTPPQDIGHAEPKQKNDPELRSRKTKQGVWALLLAAAVCLWIYVYPRLLGGSLPFSDSVFYPALSLGQQSSVQILIWLGSLIGLLLLVGFAFSRWITLVSVGATILLLIGGGLLALNFLVANLNYFKTYEGVSYQGNTYQLVLSYSFVLHWGADGDYLVLECPDNGPMCRGYGIADLEQGVAKKENWPDISTGLVIDPSDESLKVVARGMVYSLLVLDKPLDRDASSINEER